MKILLPLAILVAVLLWYAVQGREWLKSKTWATGFFAVVEPVEIALFRKSETILFARLKMLSGVALASLTLLGTIDITPLMPLVPDQYEPLVTTAFKLLPLLLTVIGWLDERLRYTTTKPIALVAVAERDISPPVLEAIAAADVAKQQAVAVVTERGV